jgi:hypothetical protein
MTEGNQRGPCPGVAILSVLAVLISAPLTLAQAPATKQAAQASAGQGAAQAPATTRQPFGLAPADDGQPVLQVVEGRLTLKVRNARLGWLLSELTKQVRLVVQVGQGAGGELVTMDLQDVPLDEALRQMLRNQDAFFFYGSSTKQDPSVLQVVWVYAKGKGQGLQPVPPENWASTKDLEAGIANDDPEVRLNAITAFIDRVDSAVAMPVALHAMTSDPDAEVRAMTLYAARSKGLKLPPEVLSGLLVADSSESVRFLALEGLARDPNARFYAETALRDPSPHLRHKAQEILNQLEAGARRPKR